MQEFFLSWQAKFAAGSSSPEHSHRCAAGFQAARRIALKAVSLRPYVTRFCCLQTGDTGWPPNSISKIAAPLSRYCGMSWTISPC